MTKMFYNLKETAERLNKTEEEVMSMAQVNGELQLYRDGAVAMFKRTDVDALSPESKEASVDFDPGVVRPLSAISPSSPNKLITGIPELDAQFGGGPPLGKISIWSGESGLGKSRLGTTLAVHLNRRGYRLYYLTTELPPEEFSGEKLNGYSSSTFFINRTKSLSEAVSDIVSTNPKWVVIDSINLIREFRGGRGGEAIIDGYQNKDGTWQNGLRWAAEQANCHICCICQQNADGSIKGGTEFTHMGDIAIYLNKVKGAPTGVFGLRFGKNRYGLSDSVTYWKHESAGVVCVGDQPYWVQEDPAQPQASVPPPLPQDEEYKEPELTAEYVNWLNRNGMPLDRHQRAAFEKGRYKGVLGAGKWLLEGLTGKYH